MHRKNNVKKLLILVLHAQLASTKAVNEKLNELKRITKLSFLGGNFENV